MKHPGGFTIIQIMVVLLIVGIVGSIAADYLIDMRCQNDVSRKNCAEKNK